MDKLKAIWKKPLGKIACLLIAAFLLLLLLIKIITPSAGVQQIATRMQTDSDTVVKGDVQLTTQETLNTVVGQEARLANQLAQDDAARQKWEADQARANADFKAAMSQELKKR